jgi:hypothetical protein
MPKQVDDSTLDEGITPKAAIEILERMRDSMRGLERAAAAICAAYDAELHRVYGYDFARPLPGGADPRKALTDARAEFSRELAVLQPPTVNKGGGIGFHDPRCACLVSTGDNPSCPAHPDRKSLLDRVADELAWWINWATDAHSVPPRSFETARREGTRLIGEVDPRRVGKLTQ